MAKFGSADYMSGVKQSDGGFAMFTAAVVSTSAAITSVDSGATSVTLLAANANRKGATITNTDANALYINMAGGTASATAYSVALALGGTYSVPSGYTGAITGIWALDGTGTALVTEYT